MEQDKAYKKFVVTGIGTDVGKTVISAIIAQSLKAYYWKPVQAGDLDRSDSIRVWDMTSDVTVLPEAVRLQQPMSPHAAAALEGIEIKRIHLQLPQVNGNLVVEGAGGLMVPFNQDGMLFADLICDWDLPVILVSRHYLGSINHTLLSLEVLKNRKITVAGIVFVGDENPPTEEIIQKISGVGMIARIPLADEINQEFIREQAERLSPILNV